MTVPPTGDLPLSPLLENIALMPEQRTPEEIGQLHRRRITLADGRYLIFYTFDEESQSSTHDQTDVRPQSETKLLATEESGV